MWHHYYFMPIGHKIKKLTLKRKSREKSLPPYPEKQHTYLHLLSGIFRSIADINIFLNMSLVDALTIQAVVKQLNSHSHLSLFVAEPKGAQLLRLPLSGILMNWNCQCAVIRQSPINLRMGRTQGEQAFVYWIKVFMYVDCFWK